MPIGHSAHSQAHWSCPFLYYIGMPPLPLVRSLTSGLAWTGWMLLSGPDAALPLLPGDLHKPPICPIIVFWEGGQ